MAPTKGLVEVRAPLKIMALRTGSPEVRLPLIIMAPRTGSAEVRLFLTITALPKLSWRPYAPHNHGTPMAQLGSICPLQSWRPERGGARRCLEERKGPAALIQVLM